MLVHIYYQKCYFYYCVAVVLDQCEEIISRINLHFSQVYLSRDIWPFFGEEKKKKKKCTRSINIKLKRQKLMIVMMSPYKHMKASESNNYFTGQIQLLLIDVLFQKHHLHSLLSLLLVNSVFSVLQLPSLTHQPRCIDANLSTAIHNLDQLLPQSFESSNSFAVIQLSSLSLSCDSVILCVFFLLRHMQNTLIVSLHNSLLGLV